MASIVYQTNKKTGHIYAFRSESYRDPITKKPRSKRTYLGRYDPETDRIIPKAETTRRNRATYAIEEEYATILEDLQQKLEQQGELEMARLRITSFRKSSHKSARSSAGFPEFCSHSQ